MKRVSIGLSALLLLGHAHGATHHTESTDSAFLLEYSRGADLEQVGLGFGIHPQNTASGFGGLYYGEKKLNQGFKTDIQTLGFRGFSTEGGVDDPRGADITLAISRTESKNGYKRTGFSGRGILHIPVYQRATWFIGADMRPTFLSFDWHNDVLSEIGFESGLNVRLLDDLSAYITYYHETRLNDDFSTSRFGQGVSAGFNLVW